MINKINNIVLYVLISFSIYCALIIGISWDELAVIERGHERLKYLFSFGFYDYIDYRDQRFYPGFYNTLAALITKIFPRKFELEIFHLTNSLFSISTIFGISKISRELFNKKVGQIVFVLCFFNPVFFGHIATNPKDMIVAFSNVWTAYLIIRYIKNQHIDEKRNLYTIFMGLVIGLGTGVRIVFLGTLIPIILISFLDIFFLKKLTDKKFSYKKFLIDLFKILTISYLIMVSCWPETHQNIFIMPFELFFESLNNQFGLPFGLLNGNIYNTSETPKSYLIINLLYKLPEFILFTYAISIFIILKNRSFFFSEFKFFDIKIILIIFIIIFPNILLFLTPYAIYDGLRLFLYIMPYICIIPGLIIYYLIINYKNIISKIFLAPIFLLFVYFLLVFFSLTPYQYTYLNMLNGDFSKAYKKFENDYWAVTLKELVNQIPNNKNLVNNKEIKIAFCGAPNKNIELYLKKIKNFQFKQVNWLTEDYDYIIMTNRVIDDDRSEESLEKNNLMNVKTCFDRFKGNDVITVRRNGLILSTLRKKI